MQDFTWDINDPPGIFYNIIEDLITVSEDTNIPKTNNQLVSYALKLICTTGNFETNERRCSVIS